MVRIEGYKAEYRDDVVKIIENFYDEAIWCFELGIDKGVVIDVVTRVGEHQVAQVFLLIINGKCEGVLGGVEAPSLLNKRKIFQELIWYVNKPYRMHGVQLLKEAEQELKKRGFNKMIMAAFENSKTEKIERLYTRMGYRKFETHYCRDL